MKAYVTKYAMTAGVLLVDGELSLSCRDIFCWKEEGKYQNVAHGEGRDWHLTLESAQRRFEEMKAKKIASLKKSLVKIERLKFEVMIK